MADLQRAETWDIHNHAPEPNKLGGTGRENEVSPGREAGGISTAVRMVGSSQLVDCSSVDDERKEKGFAFAILQMVVMIQKEKNPWT